MYKPIPIKDLIHVAALKVVDDVDMYGNETYTNVDLTRVRFEPTRKTMLSNLGEGKDDKFLMFFDLKNSRPKNQEFTKLNKIVFHDVELTIREIAEEYDGDKLHHYEIYLN